MGLCRTSFEEGLHDLAVNVQGHQDMFGNGGSQHASEFAGVNLDIDVVKTGTVNHAGDQALVRSCQITGAAGSRFGLEGMGCSHVL